MKSLNINPDKNDKLTTNIHVRFFKYELALINRCVNYCEDYEGFKNYSNRSHFIRCAVIKLIKNHLNDIQFKTGRPKKIYGGRVRQ